MRRSGLLFLAALSPCAAWAQTPAPPPLLLQAAPETVYSDAQREKDDAIARHFVQDYLASEAVLEGQFARWKQKVCPHVWGLTPVASWVVEHQIKQTAQKIGAPVEMEDPCAKPNLLVIVTPDPQGALDSIAEKAPVLVAMQEIKRLQIKYFAQSWYVSLITDYDGRVTADVESPDGTPPTFKANDSRLHTGLTAQMGIATVIIDAKAAEGTSLGAIADYAAMVGLSQTRQRGLCQPVATIANLLVPGCDAGEKSDHLTDVDLAMLTGLYQAPDTPEILQRQRIMGAMKNALAKMHGGTP